MSYNMRVSKPSFWMKVLSNMKLLSFAAGLCILAQWLDYPDSKQCGSVGYILFCYCLFRSICGRLDR